jgi:hypothetical protein
MRAGATTGSIVRVPLAYLLALTLLTCAHADERAFKGWELYSWVDGAEWRFALLVGTNRIKFCDEIKSPKGALTLEQAAQALDGLADLEWVSWIEPGERLAQDACPLALPPPAMIERLRTVCETRKLSCMNWAGIRPKT